MQSTAQSTLSFKRDTAPLKGSYSIDVRGDGALACGTLYRLAQAGATYRMVRGGEGGIRTLTAY